MEIAPIPGTVGAIISNSETDGDPESDPDPEGFQ